MRAGFSEFSFGYALTESLVRQFGRPWLPPIFPSLLLEGRTGFDVGILGPRLLVFLQFKLSDGMVSRRAWESAIGLLTPVFFRMHLRRRNLSNQHALLLALESRVQNVFYAAPFYFREDDFVTSYTNSSVLTDTFFLRPSAIGPLPDDDEHHVAFQRGGPAYFCSKPRKIIEGYYHGNQIETEFRDRKELSNEYLKKVAKKMVLLLSETYVDYHKEKINIDRLLESRHPLAVIEFLSRAFYNCEPVLI